MCWKKISKYSLALIKSNLYVSILSIVGCVLMSGCIMYITSNHGYIGCDTYVFPMLIAMVTQLICVSTFFKDMHNQQYSDMELSFPMCSGERFTAKLLSIFLVDILPFLVSMAASTAYACVSCEKYYFSETGEKIYDKTIVSSIIVLAVIFTGWQFFALAASIIGTVSTGKHFEGVIASAIIAVSISVLPMAVMAIMEMFSCGISITGDYYRNVMIWSFITIAAFKDASTNLNLLLPNIISILISCGVIALSFLLYKKRDGRDTNRIVVSRPIFEIITAIVVMEVVMAAVVSNSHFTLYLGLPIVIALVLRLFYQRDCMSAIKVLKWLGISAAEVAVAFIVITAAYCTNGFGVKSNINYNSKEVKVSITYYTLVEEEDYTSNYKGYEGTVTGKKAYEVINSITDKFNNRKHSASDMFKMIDGIGSNELMNIDMSDENNGSWYFDEQNDYCDDLKKDSECEKIIEMLGMKYKNQNNDL